MTSSSDPSAEILIIGGFELHIRQRRLLRDGEPVRVGDRALDILLALVSRAGELIGRDELCAAAWPSEEIEQSALRVHMSALRRTLAQDPSGRTYIVNETGRGYRLIMAVESAAPEGRPGAAQDRRQVLPHPFRDLLGRAETIRMLVDKLPHQRLMTVVGPGGIGKTAVALAVARQASDLFPDGIHIVDLSDAHAGNVLNIVAESLDVGTREHHPQIAIRRYLASKRALVLLDTCEHVVDPIAKFAVELLREAPALAVLATSREPLSAEGEWLHRLTPLEVPAPDAKAEASVGGTPGMVLLIERILATGASVETRGESGQALAEICRDLGGNPLAIALAAARIGLLGPRGLLGQRASWLDLLSTPQRSGPARHQTLRATFDWSYDLLTGAEQTVLTRLSVFEGFFGLESAEAVVSDEEISPQEVVRLISELAGKSLIQPNVTLAAAGYSLQSLTRTYALEKLAAADDRSEVHLRHARHCLALARQAETEFSQEDREEWIRAFGPWLNDIRVALDWSLSASGDPTIGVALTAASAPFWFHIGALEEYQSRVERVLTLDRKVLKGNAVLELRLSLTLGYLVLNTAGPTPEMDATFARALIIADGIGDGPDRLQVLAAMTVAKLGHADYPAALQYAGRFRKAWDAIPGSQTRPFDDRLMALVLHFQGQHATARRLAERVLDMPASHRRPAHTAAVQIDRTVSMHVLLARDLWLTGSPGEAIELAHDCVSFAKSLQAGPSLCFALAMMACPIALWVGDGDSARQYTNQLVEAAAEASLFHYRGWVRCFEAAALAAGNADTLSRARLQGELPLLLTAQQDVLATFDPRFLVEQTVARANSGHAGWAAAEILRAQGEALLAGQPFAHQEAETLFLRALEIAREQGAVSWGLRAAVSLGRLWATRGRNGEAFDLVQWALDQNRDRFPTTDLQEAERLMSQLRDEDRDRVAVVAG